MTLLTSIQQALYDLAETEVPESIVSNTDNDTAQRMLTLARRAARIIFKAHNWSELATEYTFTTTASTASYALPSDFHRYLSGTWWDRENYWPLIGPATPVQWQALQSSIVSAGTRRWFRQKGGLFYLYPTPSASDETIAYEYMSNAWCESSGGDPQSDWADDSDVFRLDEDLLVLSLTWRWKRQNGIDYGDDYAEYRDELSAAIARDGGSEVLDLSGPRLDYEGVMANIPETGIGT